jgi:hypothetical protein
MEQKTYREHLESLPEEWRKEALDAAEEQNWCGNNPDTKIDDPIAAMWFSFNWNLSPQGYDVWQKRCDEIYRLQIKPFYDNVMRMYNESRKNQKEIVQDKVPAKKEDTRRDVLYSEWNEQERKWEEEPLKKGKFNGYFVNSIFSEPLGIGPAAITEREDGTVLFVPIVKFKFVK